MRADDDGGLARADVRERRRARLGRKPPREQRLRDPERVEPAAEILRMLIGEKFRGRHQRDLAAALDGMGRGQRRHQRLAAAHVALDEPKHGLGQLQIRFDLAEHPFLRPGRPKRKRRDQRGFERPGAGQRPAGVVLHPGAQEFEREMMREQFLEGEPTLGGVPSIHQQIDRRVRRRSMHVLQGFAQARQMRIGEHCGGSQSSNSPAAV